MNIKKRKMSIVVLEETRSMTTKCWNNLLVQLALLQHYVLFHFSDLEVEYILYYSWNTTLMYKPSHNERNKNIMEKKVVKCKDKLKRSLIDVLYHKCDTWWYPYKEKSFCCNLSIPLKASIATSLVAKIRFTPWEWPIELTLIKDSVWTAIITRERF